MSAAGLSKARLALMHEVMAGHVDRGELPGLVTVVHRRGETHIDTIGTTAFSAVDTIAAAGTAANVPNASGPVGPTGAPASATTAPATAPAPAPMALDTLFRLSSMTKPITAAAAMVLVEECRLVLDDPIDDLLPELANRRVLTSLDAPLDATVPASRPITLRDLLTFTLGFGIVMAHPGTYPIQVAADELELGQGPPEPQRPPAPDEWLRRLGTLPLLDQPGAAWHYNAGSDVLGVLIARASGQSFDAVLRERLFEPLGMEDTAFHVEAGDVGRFATGYREQDGALVVSDPAVGGQWNEPPAFLGGGAGLVSTAADFLAFARMLLESGRCDSGRLLARPTVRAMTSDQLTPAQKAASVFVPGFFDHHGWGYGVCVTTRRDGPSSSVGAYGWDGGLGTSWINDPVEEMVAFVLTQRMFASPVPPPVCRDFKTLVYQAIDD